MKQLTRQEIEQQLEVKYLNKVIGITIPYPPPTRGFRIVTGKVHQLAVETHNGDAEVVLMINGERYCIDVNYFLEHVQIHMNNGNTQ